MSPVERSAGGGGGGLTSPLTTKGDVWGFSTVNARIPVGSDTQVLTADSTQALGVKWAAAAASLTPVTASVITYETTASAAYTDLATLGPAATVTVGASGIVVVAWSCQVDTNMLVSVALSGATTLAASDNYFLSALSASTISAGYFHTFTGLAAGSTTFTLKYRVLAGTNGAQRRQVTAIAF